MRSGAQQVRRAGLTWREAEEAGAFERFYAEMYVPFARRRFGPAAIVRDPAPLRRRLASGALFWIERQGEVVGGMMLERRGGELSLVCLGTVLDPDEASRSGLHIAARLAALEQAELHGLPVLDFGGAMPWLTDGVLRSKHLWGAEAGLKRWGNRDLLLSWPQFTPALAAMLAAAPPILLRPEGFAGLCVLQSPGGLPEAAALAARLRVRGLAAMTVIGPQGCPAGVERNAGVETRLVPPAASGALLR